MLSHGYYSVISPEGAAAIEGRLKPGQRAAPELIDSCAKNLKITAQDNLAFGYIDAIIQEPPLGARVEHYDFFKRLRAEVIQARTDEAALSVRSMRLFREMAMRRRKKKGTYDPENIVVRWTLNQEARERLVEGRHRKYREMAQHAFLNKAGLSDRLGDLAQEASLLFASLLRNDLYMRYEKKLGRLAEEAADEIHVITGRVAQIRDNICKRIGLGKAEEAQKERELMGLSAPKRDEKPKRKWVYQSPRAREDRDITCPYSHENGCLDIWARDLYGEFAGVCPNCGHHFPMEYKWFMSNVFDPDSIEKFNSFIEAGNPTGFPGFAEKLEEAKQKLGHKSGCITFEASISGIRLVCALLMAPFRGGSVGAAEGEKFIRASERAARKHLPFLAYVHGTAGIRIQEGTNGLIQMPRCTMAVRRYIDAGGLYVVVYDTNSYAGPVASFLGCSPYQYAVRSTRLGFAGPGVIAETTGIEVPPDYHSAYNALARGHIQDIWDRREIRRNMRQALLTMGGRNLYYR